MKGEYNEVEHGEIEINDREIAKERADGEEITDPEYYQKVQHEGWKDLREKPRSCTDILFLVSGIDHINCSFSILTRLSL